MRLLLIIGTFVVVSLASVFYAGLLVLYLNVPPQKIVYLPVRTPDTPKLIPQELTTKPNYPYTSLYQHPLPYSFKTIKKAPGRCKKRLNFKILVVYNLEDAEKAEELENMIFFIHHAVERFFDIDEGFVDYYFLLNSTNLKVQFPTQCNVWVLQKDHSHFCAYKNFLGSGKVDMKKYNYFIFLQSNVVGPILPVYWPYSWWRPFLNKLERNPLVKLVGPYLSCEHGPYVPGLFFATDVTGLQIISNEWDCHKPALQSEVDQSRGILREGYLVDSLMMVFDGLYLKGNSSCNFDLDPVFDGVGNGTYLAFPELVFVRRDTVPLGVKKVYGEYMRQAEFARTTCENCWKTRGNCSLLCRPRY